MATTKGRYATMAAAGTTQATAAEMVADAVMVTTVTEAASGVILPALASPDQEFIVCNGDSTEQLLVYPRSGQKLNNATADLPLTLPANFAARFRSIDAATWIVFYG